MTQRDWLVGADRHAEAAERVLAAASQLIVQHGLEEFSISALCEHLHCSQATIYRHVGGKSAIVEGVLGRIAARVVDEVRQAIVGLTGSERVATALIIALERIRAEKLGQLMIGHFRPDSDSAWLTASPLIHDLAEEMIGHRDPLAAQWLLRVTLAVWYWPVSNRADEREIIRRLIAPPFSAAV